MKKLLIFTITVLALSQNAFAGNGYIHVQLERLADLGVAFGGHLAGNMEIKIKNGFTLPSGVKCDTNYITTKKEVDPDRAMLSLLRDAMTSQRTIELIITDDQAYTAYPGRCSLIAVNLL